MGAAIAFGGARVRIDRQLLPSQMEFLYRQEPHLMAYGGVGSSKTLALCFAIAYRASIPGAREGLCRKTLKGVKATTLHELIYGANPVLPPGSYVYNKSDSYIQIKGGGRIDIFGLDDPIKFRSLNLSGCCVDEATEITEEDFETLCDRLRLTVPMPVQGEGETLPNQIRLATNPGPPSHFLAKRFGVEGSGEQPGEGFWSVRMPTYENTFLPPDYVARRAREMTGVRLARFYHGYWAGSDRLVYDTWSRDRCVIKVAPTDIERVIVGVDEGYTHPFAAVRLELDGDGRATVHEAVCKSGMQRAEKVAAVKHVARGAEAVIVDSAAPELIAALQQAGVPAIAAKKGPDSVTAGIALVQQRLQDPGDGIARLRVLESCSPVIDEFEAYEWRENRVGQSKDEPVKENDHTMDAIRYAIMWLDSGRVPVMASHRRSQVADATIRTTGGAIDFEERRRRDANWGF